jgi:succinyl-CoA synthetase alpha subunit
MVGGVNSKKGGTSHLGLPVFATVKEVNKQFLYIRLKKKQVVMHL